jgi:hypothetical protein
MCPQKLAVLKTIIQSTNKNCMFSKNGRKILAKRITKACNLWAANVESFVEEMKGLNFNSLEDREIFIQFAEVGL